MITKLWRRWRSPWYSRVGRDCISLDASLAAWLGERLLFLSQHAHGWPDRKFNAYENWTAELRSHGKALVAYAQEENFANEAVHAEALRAMAWVTEHFRDLWD